MIPSPSELKYFLEVANTHNISRAAERLGITQPSLSQAIHRMEDAMGVPLLVRGRSGVKLTRAGERLRDHAGRLLGDWDRLRKETLLDEREIRGRYTIGCHPSVALYSLPCFLPALLGTHPGLEIGLVHDLSRKIAELVISSKVDIGIVVNPVKHPDLVIKRLCQDEVTLWKSEDCKNLDVLFCDGELAQTQSILSQLPKSGHRFKRVIYSQNLEVVASLTRAGAGCGILPGRVAQREHLAKPSKAAFKPIAGAPVFRDEICLIYCVDMPKSAAGELIRRSIEKAFA